MIQQGRQSKGMTQKDLATVSMAGARRPLLLRQPETPRGEGGCFPRPLGPAAVAQCREQEVWGMQRPCSPPPVSVSYPGSVGGVYLAAQEHLPGDSTLLWLLNWWEAFFPPLSSRQLTARRAFFVPSGPDTVFGAQCSPEEQQYLVLLLR